MMMITMSKRRLMERWGEGDAIICTRKKVINPVYKAN